MSQQFQLLSLPLDQLSYLRTQFSSMQFVLDSTLQKRETSHLCFCNLSQVHRECRRRLDEATPSDTTLMFAAFFHRPTVYSEDGGETSEEVDVACAVALKFGLNRVLEVSERTIAESSGSQTYGELLAKTFAAAWQEAFSLDRFLRNHWQLDLVDSPAFKNFMRARNQTAMMARITAIFPDIFMVPHKYLFIDCSIGSLLSSDVSAKMGGIAQVYPAAVDWTRQREHFYIPIVLTPTLCSEATMSALKLVNKLPALFGPSRDRTVLVVALRRGSQLRYQTGILGQCIVQLCRNEL